MAGLLRFSTLAATVLATPLLLVAWRMELLSGWWAVASGALASVGMADLVQTRHSVLRNYPILGHFRFLFESIRPEIRQYLIESDTEAVPFSREQRAIVYQRAKQELDKRPFGTRLDAYAAGFEWINHSLVPTPVAHHDFRVVIGGPACTQPYDASVFNISAMSFGALSANAIRALNRGARQGRFAHDTGEGSISVHHREHGGDLIWEIGSGYFGCRDAQGRFDEARFVENARGDQVRMIELKLSQGAKPGHGGVLPGPKVTPEIAQARGVPAWQDCVSPAGHSAFTTPIELLRFIDRLRTLSGGKPTGFKLAIGHPWEWFAIAKAMRETGITPDFIVVDGKEGGTGAAPAEFIDRLGTPMQDGLMLVHDTLVGLGLRERVRLGAAGKLTSGFDIARTMALGADWCNSARGFMFALGCIQAMNCHTGRCPTGVATQDPIRQRALVVPDKAQRVFAFHQNTLRALAELVAAAGLEHPSQLRRDHIVRRLSAHEIQSLSALHPPLPPGALLQSTIEAPVFRTFWDRARPDSFQAA
jgi:glutamate synthase domain-containing protein 2